MISSIRAETPKPVGTQINQFQFYDVGITAPSGNTLVFLWIALLPEKGDKRQMKAVNL